mgnify:CR=1 FL=1
MARGRRPIHSAGQHVGLRGDLTLGLSRQADGAKDGGLRSARMPPTPWPLSRLLLDRILDDRISDRFVAERVWERLGYLPNGEGLIWLAGPETPSVWREAFPQAPEVISIRPASVQLTRSIPREHKQLLKEQPLEVTERELVRILRARQSEGREQVGRQRQERKLASDR